VKKIKPKVALISVSDKTGIVEFAKELELLEIEIIATGGTSKLLIENKIKVTKVEDYTNFPEVLNGRVKTLHPKIFAGILAIRNDKSHIEQLIEKNIKPIDLVVVNLYPFEQTVSKNPKLQDAIEDIDIGGVSLIRAAAKNYESVAVIVDPNDYKNVIERIKQDNIGLADLKEFCVKAFRRVTNYDAAIDKYLSKEFLDENIYRPIFVKGEELRYGENPYQKASFFKTENCIDSNIAYGKILHGKQLSYNNILDANEAFELVKEFTEPCCAIIKHTNPCGVAIDNEISNAYKKALDCDPLSAFGCVVALNKNCDLKTAMLLKPNFVEVVVCPKFDDDALLLLKEKKNLRLIETNDTIKTNNGKEVRSVVGGLLTQSRDFPELKKEHFKTVTNKKATDKQMNDMIFAIKVAKHVKSNCVVFVKDGTTVGIGAGQMSRVDSVRIATEKGKNRIKESIMCSDAFFPFRDGVDEAAKAGVASIVQPGGSIRDQEVIDAANEHEISMVFSGIRLFKH